MSALAAVLHSGLPGRPERLAGLDAAIRAPLPLSTSLGLLGVPATDGGVAAPTAVVGALLARTLAGRRGRRVLAVAAASEENTMLHRAGLEEPAIPTAGQLAERAGARDSAQATEGLARTPSGLWALDTEGTPGRWWEAVAPISRFFDFVVTDWGAPAALDDARAASALTVVVTAADRAGLQAAVDLRARIQAPGTGCLIVVHDTGEGPRGLAEAARVNDAAWLGADPALASECPDPTRLRYRTRLALLDLAARVVTAAGARHAPEVSS